MGDVVRVKSKREWRRVALGGSSTVLSNVRPARNDSRIPAYGYRDDGEHCVAYPFIEDSGHVRRDFVCFSHEDARLIAASPTMADYISRKADEGCSEAKTIMEAINANG